MQSAGVVQDKDVFREYHRVGRIRALRGVVIALVLVALAGGAIAVAAVFTSAQQPNAPVAASDSLTLANFASTINGAQAAVTSAHFSLTMTTAGQTVTAEGDSLSAENGSAAAMTMKMSIPGVGDAETRLVDGVLYLNLGAATENKFAALDLDDSSNPLAGALSQIQGAVDPSAAIAQMGQMVISVEIVGEAVELDGVAATPYDMVVDGAALFGALGSDESAQPAPAQITFHYWVGTDNLIRKMSVDLAGTSQEILFSKWGEPVSIEAPAPDQITDLPALG